MKNCREIEPLLASWVDGAASPAERGAVQAHLDQCPPCRDRAAGERTARDVVAACRERLRPCAPPALRARCAAHAAAGRRIRPLTEWRTLVPLSVAATLLLAVGAVFVYSALYQAEALASQLALDHAKCARFFTPDHSHVEVRVLADVQGEAARWEGSYGWPVRVAASDASMDLEFLTIRRCVVTDGRTAHLMYKWRDRPLSVFVLPSEVEAVRAERLIERFGYDATLWSEHGRTYVVVGDGSRGDMAPVIRYVKANTR